MATRAPNLEFNLSSRPVTREEAGLFAADLDTLGLETSLWTLLNASAATRSLTSRPHWVRAYSGSELMGLALIVEFRRPGRCLTRTPVLYRAIDLPRIRQFIWNRVGAGIDQYSNPGFVRAGLERESFIAAALGFLLSRYLLGCLIESPRFTTPYPTAALAHFDYGVIDLRVTKGVEYFLARSRNLNRKVRKFRNKGGTLTVVEGPFPSADLGHVEGWLQTLEPEVPVPFQDNYPNMACRTLALENAQTVHVLAHLEGELVGYQSFVRCGAQLSCLSGLFDRDRPSTYHAYENIILESVVYGSAHHLSRIDYGPVLNPTKAKLMTHFIPTELRYYTRATPLRHTLDYLLKRSLLSPRTWGTYMGQQPVWLAPD